MVGPEGCDAKPREEELRTWAAEDWRMPPFTITGLVTKSRLSSFEERELRELASVMSERSWKVEG